ncbi:MAG: hypothetical protein DRJ96_05365 [Thermoprotei archaeon]|nr:MAG: hypothetical protein DRJ96_05365 [Thermoprotei archaeon]
MRAEARWVYRGYTKYGTELCELICSVCNKVLAREWNASPVAIGKPVSTCPHFYWIYRSKRFGVPFYAEAVVEDGGGYWVLLPRRGGEGDEEL